MEGGPITKSLQAIQDGQPSYMTASQKPICSVAIGIALVFFDDL
jgi:hypothetical protein